MKVGKTDMYMPTAADVVPPPNSTLALLQWVHNRIAISNEGDCIKDRGR